MVRYLLLGAGIGLLAVGVFRPLPSPWMVALGIVCVVSAALLWLRHVDVDLLEPEDD